MTLEIIKDYIAYNEETGIFTWKKLRPSQHRQKIGDEVGHYDKGLVHIKFNQQKFSASRLAWFYIHGAMPNGKIEHINGNTSDNSAKNLQLVSQEDLCRKVVTNKRNKTGYPGVSYNKNAGKFVAVIRMRGKSMHLGCFDSAEEAANVYAVTKEVLHERDDQKIQSITDLDAIF
jgi:hypothetical protein